MAIGVGGHVDGEQPLDDPGGNAPRPGARRSLAFAQWRVTLQSISAYWSSLEQTKLRPSRLSVLRTAVASMPVSAPIAFATLWSGLPPSGRASRTESR